MGKLAIEQDRANAAGESVVGNAFVNAAQVRNIDSTLTVGDEFTIKLPLEVRGIKMGGTRRDGKPIVAEYIFVENQAGEAKKFFPSMLQKRVTVYEKTEPGESLKLANVAPVVANGSAAVALQNYGDVNKFFADFAEGRPFAGKKLKVTNVNYVTTKVFGQDRLTETPVMTIDLV